MIRRRDPAAPRVNLAFPGRTTKTCEVSRSEVGISDSGESVTIELMSDMFPASWKQLPLKDCMAAIIDYRGVTPKKTTFGVPLITAKIVKGGRILDVEEYRFSSDWWGRNRQLALFDQDL